MHRLQHATLATVRHFGLLCVLVNTIWLAVPVQADVDYGDAWETATTKTTWYLGAREQTVFYCVPQVVDVGAGFVEYNIERVKANEYWVDCPTSSFRVKTPNTEVWAVNRSEQVLSKCIWQLWSFNGSAWLEVEDSESQFRLRRKETQASLEHWRLMEDSSTFNVTWTFANLAKASVTFTAGQARPYAVTWHVESPRATNESQQFETIQLYEEEQWLCLLRYYDARLLHNQTMLSAIGQTGRKAVITFCNKTFQVGEEAYIDPDLSTFYSEASRDGWIRGGTLAVTSETWLRAGYVYGKAWRSYISFDTSSIPANETVDTAKLELYATAKRGTGSVNLEVYQGYYGTTLDTSDWSKCTTYEGILLNTGSLPLPNWYALDVSTDNLNLTGLTQYKIVSSDEAQLTAVDLTSGDGTDPPVLTVYYLQEEEDETKGEGSEGTGGGGLEETVEAVVSTFKAELAQRGLYWIIGGLIVVTAGGVLAGTKTKKVHRTARGKTGGGSRKPSGTVGSRKAQPRGTPKKKSRDARGRFK